MMKVRIGILGCGPIVLSMHLPTLRKRPDVEIVALAEPNEAFRRAALECGAVLFLYDLPNWPRVVVISVVLPLFTSESDAVIQPT